MIKLHYLNMIQSSFLTKCVNNVSFLQLNFLNITSLQKLKV